MKNPPTFLFGAARREIVSRVRHIPLSGSRNATSKYAKDRRDRTPRQTRFHPWCILVGNEPWRSAPRHPARPLQVRPYQERPRPPYADADAEKRCKPLKCPQHMNVQIEPKAICRHLPEPKLPKICLAGKLISKSLTFAGNSYRTRLHQAPKQPGTVAQSTANKAHPDRG